MMDLFIKTWYLWVLVLLAAIYRLYKPAIKGFFGEKMISGLLGALPNDEYTVVNDIMLPTDRGTTQIDHVVVSIYGLFVIETKNYKGWIYGNEKSEYWTQNLFGKKYKFMNPIRQNYKHTLALKKLLKDYGDIPIIPIVAFSGECELKIHVTSHVTYYSRVSQIIRSYSKTFLTGDQAREIADVIKDNHINSHKQRKEHVAAIHERVNEVQIKAFEGICPQCGGRLVGRNGKYGAFIGCSNYPRCRYIQSGNNR